MNIVSTIVSFLGGSFFGVLIKVISDHLTRKNQKEINSMQLKEKQQEIQLEWDNELRKLLGSYISYCYKLNHIIDILNKGKIKLRAMESASSNKELLQMMEQAKENIEAFSPEDVDDLIKELTGICAQIKMYLFQDDPYAVAILVSIEEMNNKLMKLDTDNIKELNVVITAAREYFKHQWVITDKVISDKHKKVPQK